MDSRVQVRLLVEWSKHGCAVREIARAFHFEARSFRRRFHQLLVTLQRLIVAAPSACH